MKNVPSYLNLWTRFSLVLLGVTWMIGLPIVCGFRESYSRYHAEFPFIFTAIFCILAMGILTHRNREWICPSVFLILVTLFNMNDFPFMHHACAIAFFPSATYAMWNDKRVGGFGLGSLCVYPLILISAFWFEMIQVLLVLIFHLVSNIKLFRALRRSS